MGDSFTEGVGDADPARPNGVRGWADRVAEVLATKTDDFRYANLAIRGRKLRPIIAEQLEPALALAPDVVTIHAGGNDVLRPKVDIDDLLAAYDPAIARLTAQVPTVVMFTAADPGDAPFWGALRGRWAVYNEGVREIADRHGARLVDYWRLKEYYDTRLWAEDRIHMSPAGHQRMAMAVLDTLAVEHSLTSLPLPDAPVRSRREALEHHWEWTRVHAGPWVKRRMTGRSSGDAMSPRYPLLTAL